MSTNNSIPEQIIADIEKDANSGIIKALPSKRAAYIRGRKLQWQLDHTDRPEAPVNGNKWESESLPLRFGMYICKFRVQGDDGLTYIPVAYVQYDTVRNEWTNPPGEILAWLDESQNVPSQGYSLEQAGKIAEKYALWYHREDWKNPTSFNVWSQTDQGKELLKPQGSTPESMSDFLNSKGEDDYGLYEEDRKANEQFSEDKTTWDEFHDKT